MKVIVDDKIPYIKEAIEQIAGEVVFVPGDKFTPELVKDADALIIRTRTFCNRQLLEGSNVQFIATATIGFDHIDTEYCREAGIAWTNAPGSNSSSVAQYIESCLLLLQAQGLTLKDKTIGIVGVGNVGKKIELLGHSYHMNVLLNDPPRTEAEGSTSFISLQRIAEEADIITFHTLLNREGKYKTFHLADENFFRLLRKKPILMNTSRGEVIDTTALLKALNSNIISEAIIDVWENEPYINNELMEEAFIATPHIAGYSADGKANATRMSLQALCRHFDKPFNYEVSPPAPTHETIIASSFDEALLQIYDPRADSNLLKENPALFEWFRGNYPLRREKEAYKIEII